MNQRLPFYMVYDTGFLEGNTAKNQIYNEDMWDEEKRIRRDYEYMKCIYPDMVKKILPYVEEECDRLEYVGSVMYDEYPDCLQIKMLCRKVYNKVIEKLLEKETQSGGWLEDMIQVMVYQEILKRRSEYRKYRKR